MGANHWRLATTPKRCISAAQLTKELRPDDARFQARPAKENLVFGTTLSDHMLTVEWDKVNSWGPPKIVPYHDLHISPAASCLHYGKWERKMPCTQSLLVS